MDSELPIIDISPLLTSKTPVWPGDRALSREVACRVEDGATITLSSLHTTVHIGAHADAPSHFAAGAPSIAEVPLAAYVGLCWVAAAQADPETGLVRREGLHLPSPPVAARDDVTPPRRLLLKTDSVGDPQQWSDEFAAVDPELIAWLGERGTRLLGIDTPSVDPFSSKDLPAHQALLRYEVVNLEGLDLRQVEDGWYELIALPLRLAGFDASPVRAILRGPVAPEG